MEFYQVRAEHVGIREDLVQPHPVADGRPGQQRHSAFVFLQHAVISESIRTAGEAVLLDLTYTDAKPLFESERQHFFPDEALLHTQRQRCWIVADAILVAEYRIEDFTQHVGDMVPCIPLLSLG